jgi:DNA-binding NarL/FixJ family response regulator
LDGRQAIALALELEPDVVVMDLNMPGLDGFSATRAILAASTAVRVLVLSGSNDPADIVKARQAGAWGYVTKDNIAGDLLPSVIDAAA